MALASYVSGLRLPDTGEYENDEDEQPRRSVPPLMTALCNEVEIMYVVVFGFLGRRYLSPRVSHIRIIIHHKTATKRYAWASRSRRTRRRSCGRL